MELWHTPAGREPRSERVPVQRHLITLVILVLLLLTSYARFECFAKCSPSLIDKNLACVEHACQGGKAMNHAWPASGDPQRRLRPLILPHTHLLHHAEDRDPRSWMKAGATPVRSVAKSGETSGAVRFIPSGR